MENPESSSQLAVNSSQANIKPTEIITVPITDLTVPTWNPRKFMDEAKMTDLTSYLEKGGLVPRPWVWKGSGEAPYMIISGQRRLEAYRRLGRTQIEVEILDVSLEEAKILAITSNVDEEMSWWEWCKSIGEALKDHSGNQRDLAAILGISQTKVSRSKQILEALNPSAMAQIELRVIKNDPSYELAEKVVFALTDLNDPQKVEEALKVVIDKRMRETQAKKLVEWVKSGNSPETYTVSVKSGNVKKYESGGSNALGDGSVDDGVAGFEKLASAGIAEQQTEAKDGQPEIPTTQNAPTLRESQGPEQSRRIGVGPLDDSDPNTELWKGLPSTLKIQKVPQGYQLVWDLSEAEAPVAVYGALAWLEHAKFKAKKGTEDHRYRKALPGLLEACVDNLKKEGEKVRKFESVNVNPEKVESIEGTVEPQKSGEKELSGTGVASSNSSAYSADSPRNDGDKAPQGFLNHVKSMVKDKMKTAPSEVTDALLKDGKQAINYQIRKGMRGILKDWL
jgi:ParB/RepB/Spo0J family partition protein